jgi:hypothetical protein
MLLSLLADMVSLDFLLLCRYMVVGRRSDDDGAPIAAAMLGGEGSGDGGASRELKGMGMREGMVPGGLIDGLRKLTMTPTPSLLRRNRRNKLGFGEI